MFRWLLFAIFVVIAETYAYQAFKTVTKVKWLLVAYQLISLFAIVYIVYQFTQFDRKVGQTRVTLFTLGLVLIIYIPKILLMVFMFFGGYFSGSGRFRELVDQKSESDFLPDRPKFVNTIALGIASIPVLAFGLRK